MKRTSIRAIAAGAVLALAATAVAACGSSTDEGNAGSPTTTEEQTTASETPEAPDTSEGEAPGTSGEGEGGSDGIDLSQDTKKDLTIPIAAGWDEDVAVSHLFKYVLEQNGYTVKLQTLDIGPVFEGVAGGDYDIFFDTWLPNTHEDYWEKIGDKVEDIGTWYEEAPLTIAVPEYVDIDSMEQLADIAGDVDKTITGIDPGAGLTRVTNDSMMPEYGLDDWKLQTSSTPAMLAALKSAIDAEEPIVVTLWRPHWAYAAFPIKDLEDPKGAMGDPDEIHVIGSKEFVEANPGLTEVLKNFTMDADTLGSLEAATVQNPDLSDAEIQEAVAEWVKENQEYVDGILG